MTVEGAGDKEHSEEGAQAPDRCVEALPKTAACPSKGTSDLGSLATPSMMALGTACLSAVAAGLALWFRPGRQETIFGLSVGALVGLGFVKSFRGNQAEKERIKQLAALEWEEIVQNVQKHEEEHADQLVQAVYWIKRRDTESLGWLNAMVRIMWPYYNEAICNSVVAALEPLLARYKPSFMRSIAFESFTLGESPFQFHRMRMVKMRDGVVLDNEVEFLMDIRWDGDVNINLAFAAVGAGDLCEIKISHMVIVGTARVLLRPAWPKIPCFGAVSVSFIDPPAIDFDLDLTGALALTSPIEGWIKPMIGTFVNDNYVWPQQLIVPMLPPEEVPPELYMPKIKGILRVRFIGATGLKAVDLSGSSDPYVVAFTVAARRFNTKHVANSTDPKWDEETYFRIMEVSQYLYIQVNDKDTTVFSTAMGSLKSEVLGRARIGPLTDISGLISGGIPVEREFDLGLDHWTTLQEDGSRGPGKGSGKIQLLLEYMPLEMLQKRTATSSHRKSGHQAQNGLLFCQVLRGINLGTGSVQLTGKLSGYPEMTKTSAWKKLVLVEDTEESAGEAAGGGGAAEEDAEEEDGPRTLSEVVWAQEGAFFDIKCDSNLCLEVYKTKAKGLSSKLVGRLEIPLALVADHREHMPAKRKYNVHGLFELEGTPQKAKYKGAAVELDMEWVPLDNREVIFVENLYETMGILKVRLCHASGLRQTDKTSDTDPFVELKVGKRHRFKSTVIDNNRNPVWMEEFSFPRVDRSNSLMLTVWDEGPIKPEHNGDVCVPISAVIRNGGQLSGIWQLQNVKKGSVCLDIVWLPYGKNLQPFPVNGPSRENELFTWPETPVEELVPPFAFEIELADVEVELRGGRLSSAEALGHVHCGLHLKGTTHTSKASASGSGDLVWGEKYTWKAVQVFDVLDIAVFSGKAEIGVATVELWNVKKAGGTMEDSWEVHGVDGCLDMAVTMKLTPEAAGGGAARPGSSGACLNVTVMSAANLEAKDMCGTSDPACVLKLHTQSFKTSNKFKTLSPTWMEHFQFTNIVPDDVLEIKVHDYDRVGKYDPLGHVYIPLTDVTTSPGKVLQDTWKLEDIRTGDITLKLQWVEKSDGAVAVATDSPQPALSPKPEAPEPSEPTAPRMGTLKMVLHGCVDLPPHTRLLGSMNCYVKAQLEKGTDIYRSSVFHNSQNPEWTGEGHTFRSALSNDMLRIRLADKNTVGRDVLGYVMVPVKQAAACAGQPLRKEWACTSDKGTPAGRVDLTLMFEDSNN